MDLSDKTALLSSEKGYTVFRFDNHVIRFKAPYSLEKYSEIKKCLTPGAGGSHGLCPPGRRFLSEGECLL